MNPTNKKIKVDKYLKRSNRKIKINNSTCFSLIRMDKDLIWSQDVVYRKYSQYQIEIGNRTSQLLGKPRSNTWQGCFVKI